MAEQPAPAPETSPVPGRILDQRQLPPGVVPRHLQQWVLIGVALVMVGILAVSGPPAKPRATAAPSPAAATVDANQARIEDYQRRIQEQAQRLAAEQAQLELTKQAVVPGPDAAAGPTPRRSPAESSMAPATSSLTRDARDERARVADNVAYSRSPAAGVVDAKPGTGVTADSAGLPPQIAQWLAPVVSSALPGSPAASAPPAAVPATPTPAGRVTAPTTDSGDAQYTLYEGTVIETVLTNRLDGTFSGPVNCLVSVPVYAADHLVIPAGARVLGEATAVNTFGQSRLAVVFHRLIQPNGVPITLDRFRGLNQIGDVGLRDQVDRHYAQIFGVSLALGAIAGFAQGQTTVGLDATTLDTYRQGVGASVAQSSTRVLDRFLNLLPTVTIREGHRIKVYLSSDLPLPAYRDPLRPTGGHP
jgi:type IV secretion system protein VirB10